MNIVARVNTRSAQPSQATDTKQFKKECDMSGLNFTSSSREILCPCLMKDFP